MTDLPLREALRATLEGLKGQVPKWMPPGPYEGFDEDGEPFHAGARERADTTSVEHLHWMIDHALEHINNWPTDKTSRWIGFVHGVLAVKSGTFSVGAERDRTRPIFHEAYEAMGLNKPETAER